LQGQRVLARLHESRWRKKQWQRLGAATALVLITIGTTYWYGTRSRAPVAPTSDADSGFESLFPDSLRKSPPPSAEARRLYAEALNRMRSFDTLAARDLLRNAVTVAPEHALSHAALAAACNSLGYDTEAKDEARKALELSRSLPRQDRLSIEGG